MNRDGPELGDWLTLGPWLGSLDGFDEGARLGDSLWDGASLGTLLGNRDGAELGVWLALGP